MPRPGAPAVFDPRPGERPGRRPTGPAQGTIFTRKEDAVLKPGLEYVVLLSADDLTTAELVLPVVSGTVVSPRAEELNGMTVDQALSLLGKWAQERKP